MVSLADAREAGAAARATAKKNIDPIAQRQADRAASVVLEVLMRAHGLHYSAYPQGRAAVAQDPAWLRTSLPRSHRPGDRQAGRRTSPHTDVLRILQPHGATKTTSMVRAARLAVPSAGRSRGVKPAGLTEDQRNLVDWQLLPRTSHRPARFPALNIPPRCRAGCACAELHGPPAHDRRHHCQWIAGTAPS